MSKSLAPIAIVMMSVSSTAIAQGAPPPPPYRSGSVSCEMFDEDGETFGLSGELGNWRAGERLLSSPKATLRVRVSQKPELAQDLEVSEMNSGVWWISNRPTENTRGVVGQISAGYTSDATIMFRTWDNEGKKVERFVGFCTWEFSTEMRTLPQ